MRRVLFITYHFPPSTGGGIPRIVSFTRGLPARGWVPTVLTTPPQGNAAVDAARNADLPAEVEVVRAYCPVARAGVRGHARTQAGARGELLRRAKALSALAMVPDPIAPWIPFALAEGTRHLATRPFDAVLATYGPPSSLIVGAALARRHRLPLVLDFRDLWSDLPFRRFPSAAHRAALRRLERLVVEQAAGITTVSDAMSDYFRTHFPRREPIIKTVLNGFEEDALSLVRDARREPGRPFRICYSGAAYEGYDLTPFLRAVKLLADRNELTPQTFRFTTLGSFAHDVAVAHGIGEFHDGEPFLPRRTMFDRFAEIDAFLIVEMGEYGARFGYPVKLFDYLLTGKPILGIVVDGGNTQALLREAGHPHHHSAASVERLADSLRALIAARDIPPKEVRLDMPPLARFRRWKNVDTLAEVLDAVSARTPSASISRA